MTHGGEGDACALPSGEANEAEIREILTKFKRVAVVGLSNKPDRDSHKVARYLMNHGYEIIPVNPNAKEILGQVSYPDLASIPHPPEIVDIFRRPGEIPAVVNEAIRVGAKAVWMQLGLAHPESAAKAKEAGLLVVQCRCIKVEHERLQKVRQG